MEESTAALVNEIGTIEVLQDIRTMLLFLVCIVILFVVWFLFRTFSRFLDKLFQD